MLDLITLALQTTLLGRLVRHEPDFQALCKASAVSQLTLPAYEPAVQIQSKTANYVEGLQPGLLSALVTGGGLFGTGYDLCNVTVTYTHPGWNDTIHVTTYLPDQWNERLQALGGAGFITGGESSMQAMLTPMLNRGFAVTSTDGGHTDSFSENMGYDPSWARNSSGDPNIPLIKDFAHVALHDMAVISKAVVQSHYGRPAKKAYFYGSSTGGRQGHMFAQRYPKDFDGIVALFPAINFTKIPFANIVAKFYMDMTKSYPAGCEFRAITARAISACDALDGVVDGIISRPGLCNFDPRTLEGLPYTCFGVPGFRFSKTATEAAHRIYTGPRSATGGFQWYGFGKDASLSLVGLESAATSCTLSSLRTQCSAPAFSAADVWIRYFVLKNPHFQLEDLTQHMFDQLFEQSTAEWGEMIGTADPDLSEFRRAGGKMLNWHGMADQIIPVNGSVDYYERVMARDGRLSRVSSGVNNQTAGTVGFRTQDYYRLFLAPGADHIGLSGLTPSVDDILDYIMRWVEGGYAADTLRARGRIGLGTSMGAGLGIKAVRDLCAYPKVQHYVANAAGDSTVPESFICV